MYFFIRTQNPRPTFHLDMTAEERAIMDKHVAYWSEKASQGIAIIFGHVMDPEGVYGIGIYQVQDEAEMRDLLKHDPANGLLKYEVLPMARAVTGTEKKAISSAVKNIEKRDLVVTRIIDAPVEKVWKAWTDPEEVKKWWGPEIILKQSTRRIQ